MQFLDVVCDGSGTVNTAYPTILQIASYKIGNSSGPNWTGLGGAISRKKLKARSRDIGTQYASLITGDKVRSGGDIEGYSVAAAK